MRIGSIYAASAASSAAALIVSMATVTPTFGQGYAYTTAGVYTGSTYYAGSRYVGSRYHGGSRYLGARSMAAYGSVDGYNAPYRRYSYSSWYAPMQKDPDPRIGGTYKTSDQNTNDD